MAGRADRLKEYTLGVEVFHRGADFDPRIDTIVRTQARRLRAKLQQYYSAADDGGRIVIDLPRGTYVPVFAPRPKAARPVWPIGVPRRRVFLTGALVAVFLAGGLAGRRAAVRPSTQQSVAVLPFINFSPAGPPVAESVSEGISEGLARNSKLRVASGTSTLRYRGKSEVVRKVAAELGVSAIVEGSIRGAGDRVRVTAHLVDAKDGYRLWSRTSEVARGDLDLVQQQMAQGITTALGVSSHSRPAANADPDAYRLYLKGRFAPRPLEAIGYLNEALRADPLLASAWIAKAEVQMSLAWRAAAVPAAVYPEARAAATRAIALGHDTAAAHLILANVAAILDWNWRTAEREYLRALELDPYDGWAHLQYAQLLVALGRTDEAIEQIQRIGPVDQKAKILTAGQAGVYYMARNYDRVISFCTGVLEAAPDTADCRYWMGRAYFSKGMKAEAIASLEKRDPGQGQGFGFPITAYVAAGRRSDALRLREQIEGIARKGYVSPVSLAQMHFSFGEEDAAFRQLERALRLKDHSVLSLNTEPVYDTVRSDLRFQRILRKVGF